MHPQNVFMNYFSKLPANPQFETSVEELITCTKCTWAEACTVCAPSFRHPKGPMEPPGHHTPKAGMSAPVPGTHSLYLGLLGHM